MRYAGVIPVFTPILVAYHSYLTAFSCLPYTTEEVEDFWERKENIEGQ